jgi:mutator protein MutT
MQKICTLLFLKREHEILLAMKKRGFGEGRWNGVGGKILPDETVEQALIRECFEEIEVIPKRYEKVAFLSFSFPEEIPDIIGHVFICHEWQGEPTETEEMAPRWFKDSEIPYNAMWQDDIVWLPQVLAGKKIIADFTFDHEDNMQSANLQIVDSIK